MPFQKAGCGESMAGAAWFLSIAICLLSACGTGESSKHATEAAGVCKAPDVPIPVTKALCSEDPVTLRNSLSNLREETGAAEYRRALQALARIWKLDKSYGTDLP